MIGIISNKNLTIGGKVLPDIVVFRNEFPAISSPSTGEGCVFVKRGFANQSFEFEKWRVV